MPYNSIADLPENIRKTLPSKAQEIFLNAFNSAWNGVCKDQGVREHEIEACAFKRAWGAVKNSYRVEGDKWVSKAAINTDPTPFIIAAAQNPMLISGPLIEVDKKNLNDWGIPAEETEKVKAGLLGVPLKKCSGADAIFNEHSCDHNWNPKDEIGQIVSTHENNGWIHATAKVTDPTADSKIRSGTWTPKWSIFGGYKFEDPDKMRYGTIPKAVTLVTNPAYPDAGFRQAASKQPTSQSLNSKEDGNISENDDPKTYTQEELDQKVAEAVEADHATMTRQQEDLTKAHEEAVAAKEQEHAAALEAKDKEITKLQAASKADPDAKAKQEGMVPRAEVEAMLAAATEGMVPRSEAEKMMSAATEKATNDTMDLLNRAQLSEEIATLQASYNMIKEEDVEPTKTTKSGYSTYFFHLSIFLSLGKDAHAYTTIPTVPPKGS